MSIEGRRRGHGDGWRHEPRAVGPVRSRTGMEQIAAGGTVIAPGSHSAWAMNIWKLLIDVGVNLIFAWHAT